MQNKTVTIPTAVPAVVLTQMSSGQPQVTTGFVPFKICSHTIIQKFANSVDTFMPFSAICDTQFAIRYAISHTK